MTSLTKKELAAKVEKVMHDMIMPHETVKATRCNAIMDKQVVECYVKVTDLEDKSSSAGMMEFSFKRLGI